MKTTTKVLIWILVVIILGSIIILYKYDIFKSSESQFIVDSKQVTDNINSIPIDYPKGEDIMYHFVDNFDSYKEYSYSIDQMEDINNVYLYGDVNNLKLSDDDYGGEKSISFDLLPGDNNRLMIERRFDTPLDISRWNSAGVFSSWIKFEDSNVASKVSLVIEDINSNSREYNSLENLISTETDQIKSNDVFPDYTLPEQEGVKKWEDFKLVNNWNYLFWRADSFQEVSKVDMSKIVKYKIIITLGEKRENKQNIKIDNLRVSDGLQKKKNPTNGVWYAPNAMPQYGVFDIDGKNDDLKIRLLNVRQEQYPSNGDHTRIISNKLMPLDFTMRTRFKFVNLEPKSKLPGWLQKVLSVKPPRKNTYFRLQYDFDTEYDPGHDWFGTFISLENQKFGLITVYPIERYFKQGQEPINFDEKSRIEFVPEENVEYELDLKVIGSFAKAVIYQVKGNNLKKVGEVEYTFNRERSNNRGPLSIEATGNTHLEVYSVEVLSLDKKPVRIIEELPWKECTINKPQDKIIMFRFDDIGPDTKFNTIKQITGTVLDSGYKITLGVIPMSLENTEVISWLKTIKNNPDVEIALHAYKHTAKEFENLEEESVRIKLVNGINILSDKLGVIPYTFIPPQNKYLPYTSSALKKVGFKVLSAQEYDYNLEDKFFSLGYTAQSYDFTNKRFIPAQEVFEDCKYNLNKNGVCIILLHPQDYTFDGKDSINPERYNELVKLLNLLKGLDAKPTNFKDMVECPN